MCGGFLATLGMAGGLLMFDGVAGWSVVGAVLGAGSRRRLSCPTPGRWRVGSLARFLRAPAGFLCAQIGPTLLELQRCGVVRFPVSPGNRIGGISP